jgi:hypothetical protein
VPGKSPVKVQPEILDIFFLGELHVVYMGGGRGHVSFRMVNVTWTDFDPLAFNLHFLNQFRIAARLIFSFCEAMAGSLSVTSTAVSSAKMVVVESGEVGGSAVYIRYNNGPRTLPWSTPALLMTVLCTRFQPLRGSVCYANRI